MLRLLYILLAAALLASCGGSGSSDKRPVLMVSIAPYRYFVERISGGRFNVMALVPRSSNPESYEPTAQQILDLMNSRAYFASGYLDFETTRLRQITAENPGFPLFDLSRGIKAVHGSDGSHPDPHLWLSARNAAVIADNICKALCIIDSTNCNDYKARAQELLQHIDSVDKQVQKLTSNLVHRSFIIYHPALTYFAKDYGLKQIPVCPGGKEPSPAQIEAVLTQGRAEKADVVFVQEQFPAATVKQIARETGARTVEINPLAYNWDEEMISIAKSLAE